jgi:hypothetical protein
MPARVLLSGTGYPDTCHLLACRTTVAALCILLAGCAAMAQTVGNDANAGTQIGTLEPHGAPNVTGAPAVMIEAALDDAARRSGMARTAIKVITAEPVTWSDGSLGCPEPGMMYTQALVPGYRIVVQAGEERLDYHASTRGTPSFCPPGRAVAPIANESI